jgi:hypothetical protein
MNAFYEHHRDSIRWHYRCFDRILLNGLIQPFQQPERVVGFFNTYWRLYPVSRQHGIADHFQKWLKGWTENAKVPVVDAPKGRRDEFVEPYFKRAKPDAIVVVLKARAPARIMIAIGDKTADRWHLEPSERWVIHYNVYINDARWGRMFVRMCLYLPFSARVCVNQHHWLANRMREEGIRFQQSANAFLKCAAPKRLQELADSLTARDLVSCGQKWLARLTPFFTRREREHAGCEHRLFFSQVEYCDNLIFKRRAAHRANVRRGYRAGLVSTTFVFTLDRMNEERVIGLDPGDAHEAFRSSSRHSFLDRFVGRAGTGVEDERGYAHGCPGPGEVHARQASWRSVEAAGPIGTGPERRHARRLDRAEPDHRTAVLSQSGTR